MFLTFGEIMMRIATPGRQRWRQSLPGSLVSTWGGGEANVSVSLSMLGASARYLTALPATPITQSLIDNLRGLGVDTDSILFRDGRLGLYFVEHGANQRGSTVVYDRSHSAVSLAEAHEYDFDAALEQVHWLHVTGITPAISEVAYSTNLALVRAAKERGVTVSCDLNFRKKLWRWDRSREPKQLARDCMAELMPLVDVVIGNEEDASDVLGIEAKDTDVTLGQLNIQAYQDVASQIHDRFPQTKFVAITLRESISADVNHWGAMLYDCTEKQAHFAPTSQHGSYAAYEIRDIIDRVGGGDSFAAGLLFALNDDELSTPGRAIEFAVAASCLKHSIPGDFNYVTREEVMALLQGNASGRVQR